MPGLEAFPAKLESASMPVLLHFSFDEPPPPSTSPKCSKAQTQPRDWLVAASDPLRSVGVTKKNGHSAILDVVQFAQRRACSMLCI
jgi:hypothetical protein